MVEIGKAGDGDGLAGGALASASQESAACLRRGRLLCARSPESGSRQYAVLEDGSPRDLLTRTRLLSEGSFRAQSLSKTGGDLVSEGEALLASPSRPVVGTAKPRDLLADARGSDEIACAVTARCSLRARRHGTGGICLQTPDRGGSEGPTGP